MRHNAIVLSHYSQHACWVVFLSGKVSNPLPCTAWRCLARRAANLSSKQMKMDSGATADIKHSDSELTVLLSICMHSPRGKGKKREKNFFNFLLIAALPDTHVVKSAISYFMLGKLTHKHIDTRILRRYCLKAECWFANELSWWLILPFNWLVKGAIRIQCIDAHQERKTVGLGCLYIMCETVRFKVKHTLEHRRHVTHSLLLLLLFILIMLLNCSMIWSMNLPVSVNTCGLLCMQGVSFSSSSLFLVYFSSITALHSFSFQS